MKKGSYEGFGKTPMINGGRGCKEGKCENLEALPIILLQKQDSKEVEKYIAFIINKNTEH